MGNYRNIKSPKNKSVKNKNKSVNKNKNKSVNKNKNKSPKNNTTKRKNKNQHRIKTCIAVLKPDKSIVKNHVSGIVEFFQHSKNLHIKYEISGLTDGEHGFHIHKCGDLTEGCNSGCSHFNPDNNIHGGLRDKKSHAGDLGNITSRNGLAKGTISTDKVTLRPSIRNIIGRMIIVHRDRDDLGLGQDDESLKTGNAGKRLACGIIGIKAE